MRAPKVGETDLIENAPQPGSVLVDTRLFVEYMERYFDLGDDMKIDWGVPQQLTDGPPVYAPTITLDVRPRPIEGVLKGTVSA